MELDSDWLSFITDWVQNQNQDLIYDRFLLEIMNYINAETSQ